MGSRGGHASFRGQSLWFLNSYFFFIFSWFYLYKFYLNYYKTRNIRILLKIQENTSKFSLLQLKINVLHFYLLAIIALKIIHLFH